MNSSNLHSYHPQHAIFRNTMKSLKDTKTNKPNENHATSLEERLQPWQSQRPLLFRIPDELILEIFRFATCHNSLALGPILMVCRKRYRIAINSPSLFANITINFGTSVRDIVVERRTNYLESAIRRSKRVPLNVDLTLPTKGQLIVDMGLTDLGMIRDDVEDVSNWEFHLEVYLQIEDEVPTNPAYSAFRDFLQDTNEGLLIFMSTLAGPNGDHLLRLRSFHLEYNPSDFEDWIDNDLFHYPTPILEELALRTIDISDSFPRQIFTYPAPKLSRILVDSGHKINHLLDVDSAVK